MRIGSLFSGIGGLELGLEWSGVGHTVWQVEADSFCRRVLAKHWPDAERFTDVREVGAAQLAPVDLICGGFPCQDVSSAGQGAGLAGKRSGLWFEFARIVGEFRPQWVVVENVAGGANRWVDPVCAGLAELGYETLPIPLSACDVGAPHVRSRVFIVATHADRIGAQERSAAPVERQERPDSAACAWRPHTRPEPDLRRLDDGVPARLARGDQFRAYGNAVVPQQAEVIGWVIRELEAA